MALSRMTVGEATAIVTVETERLTRRIEQFLRRFDRDAPATIEALAFELEGRVKERTRVRTGRARNSWHTVRPGTTDSYSYKDNLGRTFDGSLRVRTGPMEAAVGSNVVYMGVLEALDGMVRVSVAELRGELARQMGDLASKV